jgi:hypothetical protein
VFLFSPLFQRFWIIRTDADDGRVVFRDLWKAVAKAACLISAPWRECFGKEKDKHALTLKVIERDCLLVLIL